ncbi:uncharacterized protein [Magallana gigas]|uniref:uncharacterized protein n=1 Tax=Magallana gigas TaxID=29159 RepID=UPI00333FBA60
MVIIQEKAKNGTVLHQLIFCFNVYNTSVREPNVLSDKVRKKRAGSLISGQHLLEDGKYPGESKEGDNSAPDNSNSVTESKVKSEEEYKTAQEVISGPIDNSNSETEFKVKNEEEYKTAQETAKNKYIGKICKTIIKEIENKDNTDRRSNVQETVDEEHMQVHFVHVKGVPDRDANDTGGADGNNTETVDTSGNVCKAMAVGDNNIAIVSATGKNNVVTAMAVGDNNIAIATAEGEDNVSEARAEGTRNEAVATSEGINVKHTAFAQGSDNKARSAAKLEDMDTIRNIIDVIKSNTCRKGTQTEEETGVKDIAHIDTENRMEPIGQESEDDIEGNTTAT